MAAPERILRMTGNPTSVAPSRELLAAVDLGSNSFHLLLGCVRDDRIQTVEHLCDNVRLAAGVDADGVLDAAHRQHAMATLRWFAGRIGDLPAAQVHAVATHAVRSLHSPDAFLGAATSALNHAVDLIDGDREARLIWRGVAHNLPSTSATRLLIDVGGGSTEFAIGHGLQALHTHSVPIGCVTISVRFFAGGAIDAARWQASQEHLQNMLVPIATRWRGMGWDECWGSSGSARTIAAAITALGLGSDGIAAPALIQLRDHMLDVGHVDASAALGLATYHQPIFVGGVAVMQAIFSALGIEHMRVSDSAMREGMLWALHDRTNCQEDDVARPM